MSGLYCVELAVFQRKNLCRMTTSYVVLSTTPDDALLYIQANFPQSLTKSKVQRIYPVRHVAISWPLGTCEIVEEAI